MGMRECYGATDEGEALAAIDRALELGVNFLDTADVYGRGANEELVGRAIRGRRDAFVVATKFGIVRTSDPMTRGVNGRPDYVRTCCEASLRRLGIETVDLYYQHRVDPDTPIEDTVGALADLVRAGKIRHIGLSEAAPETLRRAHAVHPITALQSEFSLWSRDPEDEVLPTCRALGIGFVPYSPLGRGFLTGELKSIADLAPDDYRRTSPRFQPGNFERNLELVQHLHALAARRGCLPAQLALAWVLHQGDDLVPIPGTKRVRYLEQNAAAVDITLTADELAEIDRIVPRGAASGDRYHPIMMKLLNR